MKVIENGNAAPLARAASTRAPPCSRRRPRRAFEIGALTPARYHARVDLRARLLELLAPWRVGDEPLPGVRLEDASTELGLRLRFRIDGERVWVDVTPVADAGRHASRSPEFAFGYRTEGGRNPIDAARGKQVCEAIARRSAANEAGVLAALRAAAGAQDQARIREVEVASLLEVAGPASEPFYTLSPYVGCVIGCKFCHAQGSVGA